MVDMELMIASILEVIKCIGTPACRYLGDHRNLEENMDDLRRRLNDLNIRKQDIQSAIEAEIRRGKVAMKEVEKWLEHVQRMNTKMQKIEEKLSVVSYISRARLGKLVCKMIKEVKEVYHQCNFPGGVAMYGPPTNGVTLLTTDLEGETEIKDQIWKYLMGDEVGMIGVCGMGGIGKTTIMKHVNNMLLLSQTRFDNVIWVTVSKELNVFSLQGAIARSMNQSLPEDVLERASSLIEILKRKRFVIIFDDVWEHFSLLDVGIPEPTPHGGSKLVLTSRSTEVCTSMGCKVLKVQPLSREESLNLFLTHAGHDVVQVPTLKEIVNLIVEHCDGLPLAIVTIAGSMKGVDDDHEWRNVLNELRNRVKSVKGLDTKIFECLMFSYDRLKDPKIQDCFLYCSLYPEDYAIEKNELIESWIDERLLDECGSRQALLDRGHSVLNKLVNNCLLERAIVYNRVVVRMHDVLRDMALSIKSGSTSHQYMVKAGMQLKELPDDQEWTSNLEKASLMDNSILEISPHISPKCHNLSTLLLQQNDFLEKISESFFENMHGLKVLDLSYTSIHVLPTSTSNLENLVALILRNCDKLKHVPSLARLRALRKLDLYNTAITEVPHGMEMLVNLKYLGLHSKDLKELPMGILPMFSHLQFLGTTLCLNAEEVGKLRKLEILSGSFLELQDFGKYGMSMQGQWPRNYVLAVGSSNANHTIWAEQLEKPELYKSIKFSHCQIRNQDPLVLPNDLDNLYIEECHDIKSLSSISLFQGANVLRKCVIRECEGMECIVDLSLSSYNSLQNIEELDLEGLCKLRELIRVGAAVESTSQAPTPPAAIFSSLKILRLVSCSSMKRFLSLEQLHALENLEQLVVISCKELEFIMTSSEEEENRQGEIRSVSMTTIALPRLGKLTLLDLPKLKGICSGGLMIQADSLQSFEVGGCQQLNRIHLSLPPSLKQIILDSMDWWESAEWEDPNAKDILSPFILLQPSFEFP